MGKVESILLSNVNLIEQICRPRVAGDGLAFHEAENAMFLQSYCMPLKLEFEKYGVSQMDSQNAYYFSS